MKLEEKVAAGGVVISDTACDKPRVVLVHRPRYDDWSFPKGGVNPEETIEQAALREVEEETGLRCRILRELSATRYDYRTGKGALRPKVVHYFLMEPESGSLAVSGDEVDRVEWFEARDASRALSYQRDKDLLDSILPST